MSKITGSDKTIVTLLAKSKDFEREVKEIVEFNVGEIELNAIRNAPGGGDRIRTVNGSITQEKVARGRNWTPINQAIGYQISPDGFKGSVFVERSAGEIAAYIEFGTGQDAANYLATVPQEWRDTARQFYVNGKGTIIGKPYLYPAYIKQRIEFVNDLKKAVANFGK